MTSPEMKDPITLPREVVEGALKALERASRQLTDEHKMVLNGKSWAETDIQALRQSLASAPQVGGELDVDALANEIRRLIVHPSDRGGEVKG